MLNSFSKSYWMKIGRNVKEASGNDWSPTVSSRLHSYLRYVQLVIQLKFPSQLHFSRYRIKQVKPDSPCSMHDAPYKPKICKSDCNPESAVLKLGGLRRKIVAVSRSRKSWVFAQRFITGSSLIALLVVHIFHDWWSQNFWMRYLWADPVPLSTGTACVHIARWKTAFAKNYA